MGVWWTRWCVPLFTLCDYWCNNYLVSIRINGLWMRCALHSGALNDRLTNLSHKLHCKLFGIFLYGTIHWCPHMYTQSFQWFLAKNPRKEPIGKRPTNPRTEPLLNPWIRELVYVIPH